ncbi:MAG TPA: DUF3606 domain-containing protein [Variovorax sp.]|jgi:hypothetical protein|nr:DUF3606 domain-containing protein [Variovorax sp.]
MSDNDTPIAPNATAPDTIDVQSDVALDEWAKKLDTTTQQLKDAVAEVGDRATDVEMHLKGTRSTTNTERVEEAGGAS